MQRLGSSPLNNAMDVPVIIHTWGLGNENMGPNQDGHPTTAGEAVCGGALGWGPDTMPTKRTALLTHGLQRRTFQFVFLNQQDIPNLATEPADGITRTTYIGRNDKLRTLGEFGGA